MSFNNIYALQIDTNLTKFDDGVIAEHSVAEKECKDLLNKGINCFNNRMFEKSIKYFRLASEFPSQGKLMQSALYYLGVSYYAIGDYDESKKFLSSCSSLDYSNDRKIAAELKLVLFGLDTIYHNWILLSTENINFHFQDTMGIDIKKYIKSMKFAFDTVNIFFRSKLPKKIDYFIWADAKVAEVNLKQKGSFTIPTYCLTHGMIDDDKGHELAHTISFYAVNIVKENQLIYEGVAVYFGLSDKNYLANLQRRNRKTLSIVNIWKNPKIESNAVIYPLGAEIVKMLIEWKGRELFIKFLKNQTYENAIKVYRGDLDRKIDEMQCDFDNL